MSSRQKSDARLAPKIARGERNQPKFAISSASYSPDGVGRLNAMAGPLRPFKREGECRENEKVELDLPLPPSANDYWRLGWVRGKPALILSREARAYKAAIALKGRVQKRVPLEGPVELRLVVHFSDNRSDLSNRIKVLEDALQGVAYVNDRQVQRLSAERGENRFPAFVQVTVTRLCVSSE